MARKKNYIEEEVIEKAMHLFWENGYETTSVRMLENTMGINQFSIYSSFGNKEGLFIRCLKHYKKRMRPLINKLKTGTKGLEDLKTYYYDFLAFSQTDCISKGCFIINTISEFGEKASKEIKAEILDFRTELLQLYMNKLSIDSNKDTMTLEHQANYLSICLTGLMLSSKILQQEDLEKFITTTFKTF